MGGSEVRSKPPPQSAPGVPKEEVNAVIRSARRSLFQEPLLAQFRNQQFSGRILLL
jgi:hypothetical protein